MGVGAPRSRSRRALGSAEVDEPDKAGTAAAPAASPLITIVVMSSQAQQRFPAHLAWALGDRRFELVWATPPAGAVDAGFSGCASWLAEAAGRCRGAAVFPLTADLQARPQSWDDLCAAIETHGDAAVFVLPLAGF